MEPVTYRLATTHDIEALVTLRLAFLAEVSDSPASASSLRNELFRYFTDSLSTGEFIAYVAVADSQIIATSGLVYHRNPPSNTYNGREAYIMNMFTRPQWRGQGIATKLLHLLIQFARDHSCDRASLHFHPRGQSIYAKAGFSLIETEMRLTL